MQFHSDKPIYRQIIDHAFAAILSRQWPPQSKIPSVRELATRMGVNTHTVLKAYEALTADGIIEPRRGMGYYLTPDAPARVDAHRAHHFYTHTLHDTFRQMDLLGIPLSTLIDALPAHYQAYRATLPIPTDPASTQKSTPAPTPDHPATPSPTSYLTPDQQP